MVLPLTRDIPDAGGEEEEDKGRRTITYLNAHLLLRFESVGIYLKHEEPVLMRSDGRPLIPDEQALMKFLDPDATEEGEDEGPISGRWMDATSVNLDMALRVAWICLYFYLLITIALTFLVLAAAERPPCNAGGRRAGGWACIVAVHPDGWCALRQLVCLLVRRRSDGVVCRGSWTTTSNT